MFQEFYQIDTKATTGVLNNGIKRGYIKTNIIFKKSEIKTKIVIMIHFIDRKFYQLYLIETIPFCIIWLFVALKILL